MEEDEIDIFSVMMYGMPVALIIIVVCLLGFILWVVGFFVWGNDGALYWPGMFVSAKWFLTGLFVVAGTFIALGTFGQKLMFLVKNLNK